MRLLLSHRAELLKDLTERVCSVFKVPTPKIEVTIVGPNGYYPTENKILLNVSSAGFGTIVHEVSHYILWLAGIRRPQFEPEDEVEANILSRILYGKLPQSLIEYASVRSTAVEWCENLLKSGEVRTVSSIERELWDNINVCRRNVETALDYLRRRGCTIL